ncbi:hypothetical protein BU23DRAFT_259844 [Bimuria novae-zelandiae CBS 107.79]|uniref:DUF6594 domain-containing protein n=1 Tax=Bimuria novae-zelandiae CBS 107.79 TaxID=1447943 RepID=A0A6A5UV65_9PLEO|nr:hypothetical protein BU23DRAFT_259844 [Bimuria novae-zelandiae CBS 107.79]
MSQDADLEQQQPPINYVPIMRLNAAEERALHHATQQNAFDHPEKAPEQLDKSNVPSSSTRSPLSTVPATRAQLDVDILERIRAAYAEDLVYRTETTGKLSNKRPLPMVLPLSALRQSAYHSRRFNFTKDAETVNLATLQRINLEMLRHRLLDRALRVYYCPPSDGSMGDDMSREVHEYVDALRNWDYTNECAKLGSGADPFLVTTKSRLSRDAIKSQMGRLHDEAVRKNLDHMLLAQHIDELWRLPPVERDGVVDIFSTSRNAKNRKDAVLSYLQRTLMAVLGGLFLIVPMLIMVLHNSKVTSLVTTSVFVFVFGLVVSFFLEKPMDVLSVTAAYAAVLVVFVGTSGA